MNTFNNGKSPPKTFGQSGCNNCFLRGPCGGHPLPLIRAIGCANYAPRSSVIDTDDMSPHFPERFWELWNDTDGLLEYDIGPLIGVKTSGLGEYVPLLQHTKMKRAKTLGVSVVALPLFDVVGMRPNGTNGSKYSTPFALRTAYRLRLDTKILLIGVDVDKPIEIFWREHRVSEVFSELRKLDILGVSIPNFSFFTDVPRPQILRNRKRLLLVAEAFSNAAIPVIPHLNAISEGDWEAAYEMLRKQPNVDSVAMEFQTGAKLKFSFGRECLDQLSILQQRLGRPLHPVLVGGARYFALVKDKFASFTVIDSQPFMQSIARQRLARDSGGRWKWVSNPTPRGVPIDSLFAENIDNYPKKMNSSCEDTVRVRSSDPRQLELTLENSSAYLGSQPVARGISATKVGATCVDQSLSVNQSPTV